MFGWHGLSTAVRDVPHAAIGQVQTGQGSGGNRGTDEECLLPAGHLMWALGSRACRAVGVGIGVHVDCSFLRNRTRCTILDFAFQILFPDGAGDNVSYWTKAAICPWTESHGEEANRPACRAYAGNAAPGPSLPDP